jgi:hypothetical protein
MKRMILAVVLLGAAVLVGWLASGHQGGTDAKSKVDACLAAQQQVGDRRASRGRAPPGELSDGAVVARACAPLFANAECREAMMNFDVPPLEARSSTLFAVCTRAYCPTFTAPRPSACERQAADPSGTAEQWDELRTAVLRREIGEEQAARLAAARSTR